jgi:S-phase kinase-associated protein 1
MTTQNDAIHSLDDTHSHSHTITLIAKDGQQFTIERRYAYLSNLIKTSLENDNTTELTLPEINGTILQRIIEFMNYHKGEEPAKIEKPLRTRIMRDCCKDAWDADFIERQFEEQRKFFYDLLSAANYLDMQSLLQLGLAKIASLIKGEPLEKIRDILEPQTN